MIIVVSALIFPRNCLSTDQTMMVLEIVNESMNLTKSPRTQTDFMRGTALPFTKNFKIISKNRTEWYIQNIPTLIF